MGVFDDRERAAEARFVAEQQAQFTRRIAGIRRLAEWSVVQSRLGGDAAARHVQRVLDLALTTTDDNSLLFSVVADLTSKGIQVDPAEAARQLTMLD